MENKDSKPDKNSVDKIQPRILEQEMQESYLDYAMSVIVARALPDARDGLKPVHRRILYAMWDNNLTHGAKFRKSATVVGEVLGKYHPHGDVAVYDAMVRMAQYWSMRSLMVDGQGNFGSVDGDSPAAMRYTEARMTALAEEMLTDIDKQTVDFIDNYDASRKEPIVLPAKVPNLLLNGSLGIAVGMATNIPPHNLGELCDGVTHLIDNPEASLDDLMQFIKGPDFPTAGNIYDIQAIKTAYSTGRGSIVMRATADIEEKDKGFRIIISELPYQVNKAELIIKIADLVKLKKIEGISDLRDESDRTQGVRIVVELKQNAYPKKVLNQLFDLTPMQTAFHVNMVALIDGIQPRLLTLPEVLKEFIKHRQVVVRRRAEFDLARAKERAHILEGLKIALDHIDAVISTIRKSKDRPEAHKNLMAGFKLTEIQANAILDMRLAALTNLERSAVENELKEKYALIKELELLLRSPGKILEIIKNETSEIKQKYADERRTKIFKNAIGKFTTEDLIANEQVIVTLTKGNYIKRVPVAIYRSQLRGGKGVIGMDTKEEDVVEQLLTAWTHDDLMLFTDKGRVFTTKVFELPPSSRTAKGQSLVNIIQLAPEENVTAVINLGAEKSKAGKYIFMATKKGTVKKTDINAYVNVRKSGIIAINLNPEDSLKFVDTTSGQDEVMMVTKRGQGIFFSENDVRPMGRSAAGVRGIKLRESDEVISMDVVRKDIKVDLMTILENGFGKKTPTSMFRGQHRGGVGVKASKLSAKTGNVIKAMVTGEDSGDLVMVSRLGQVIRIPLKSAKRSGRDTMGVRLMRLNGNDKVSSVGMIDKDEIAQIEQEKPTDKKSKTRKRNK